MLLRLISLVVCLSAPLMTSAAEFSLTDVQGRTHTLKIHEGKWVLVNLWATWCPPCIAEMPELESLSKARKDLVVLGLAVDGQDERRVARFAEKLKVTYPIIAGNEKLAQQFKPKGYPTSILYNTAGQQIFLKEGPVTRQEIERIVERHSP